MSSTTTTVPTSPSQALRIGLWIAQELAIEVADIGIGRRLLAGIKAKKIAIDESDEALALQRIENVFDITAGDCVAGPVLERGIGGEIAGPFTQGSAVAKEGEDHQVITTGRFLNPREGLENVGTGGELIGTGGIGGSQEQLDVI